MGNVCNIMLASWAPWTCHIQINRSFNSFCGRSINHLWPLSHKRSDQVGQSVFQANLIGPPRLFNGVADVGCQPPPSNPARQKQGDGGPIPLPSGGSDGIGWKRTGGLFPSNCPIDNSGLCLLCIAEWTQTCHPPNQLRDPPLSKQIPLHSTRVKGA